MLLVLKWGKEDLQIWTGSTNTVCSSSYGNMPHILIKLKVFVGYEEEANENEVEPHCTLMDFARESRDARFHPKLYHVEKQEIYE